MSSQYLEVVLDVTAIPPRLAGAGRYVVELVRALGERGDVELELVTRRHDAARWAEGSHRKVLPLAPDGTVGRLAWGELALGRAISSGGTLPVLHGPHYSLPLGYRGPTVATVHDLTLVEYPELHERTKVVFFRRALRLLERRADVVVVPSEAAKTALSANLALSVPVVVAPHGVDHDLFSAGEPSEGHDEAVLAELGVTPPYVLSVATLEPRKNLPGLVRAFASLGPAFSEVKLVLVGAEGWKTTELDGELNRAGVLGRTLRTGYVPDGSVAALLRRAGVVAYPSLAEGFGLPVLEALACGAPVVTSRGTSMAEVVGTSALLVDPRDTDELSRAIETSLAGGPDVAKRQADGLVRAAGYDWARSAELHVGAYRLAIERHTRRAPAPA